MPLELIIHLAAVGLLASHYEPVLNNISFKNVLYAMVGVSIFRLVVLFVVKVYDGFKIEGAGLTGTITLYLNNILAGGFWGASLIWLTHSIETISFDDPLIALIIAGLLVSTLAGSALQALLFAAFAIPCLTLLILYSATTQPLNNTLVWVF